MKAHSPCFLFWPKDWLTDGHVLRLIREQRSMYFDLLCHSWLEGGIPDAPEDVARLLGEHNVRRFTERDWPKIRARFVQSKDDTKMLVNPKLEEVRRVAIAQRTKRSQAGKRGASARWGD